MDHAETSGRPKRILVVDDDRHLQFLAGRILREAGYEVDLAADGISGLAKIREDQPDLVILDLTLPSLDGRAVLAQLEAIATPPPVLVLTAHGMHFSGAEAVKRQAAALMAKPFSLRELVETCDRILRQAEG
jgi:two-component system OmpR family response regulator